MQTDIYFLTIQCTYMYNVNTGVLTLVEQCEFQYIWIRHTKATRYHARSYPFYAFDPQSSGCSRQMKNCLQGLHLLHHG